MQTITLKHIQLDTLAKFSRLGLLGVESDKVGLIVPQPFTRLGLRPKLMATPMRNFDSTFFATGVA